MGNCFQRYHHSNKAFLTSNFQKGKRQYIVNSEKNRRNNQKSNQSSRKNLISNKCSGKDEDDNNKDNQELKQKVQKQKKLSQDSSNDLKMKEQILKQAGPFNKIEQKNQNYLKKKEQEEKGYCEIILYPKDKVHFYQEEQSKRQKNVIFHKVNKGMVNLMNTCYLNSALQCLYQTQYLNKEINKGWEQNSEEMKFVKLYEEMCSHLHSYDAAFNPFKIKKLIEKANPRFQGTQQQDSGEVMTTILNILHVETNTVKKAKIIQIQCKNEESDQSLFQEYLKKFRAMSFSLIDQLFVGYFKTTYRCSICTKQKKLFEKFNTVYLPFPNMKLHKIKLQNCLQIFNQVDYLQWECLECHGQTQHKKTMQIYFSNKILIFSLKRFNEDNKKIKSLVQIPFQLDLAKFKKREMKQNLFYELYGAIIHIGQYNYGHYIAYCYDYQAKCWGQYDDTSVKIVDQEYVENSVKKAYLLFYKVKKQKSKHEQTISKTAKQFKGNKKVKTQPFINENLLKKQVEQDFTSNQQIQQINTGQNKKGFKVQSTFYSNETKANNKESDCFSPGLKMNKGGIKNLSGTSYLSCGLQCLYQTKILNKYIEQCQQSKFIKQLKKMSQHLSTYPNAFNPAKIKSIIQDFNQRFKGNSQQDAGELVSTVLNIIHKETNSIETPKKTIIQYEGKETDSELFKRYDQKFKKMSNSVIDRVVFSYFKITHQCTKCNYNKRLFQRFNTLYLPIRKPQNRRKKIKLEDCFNDFQAQDQIDMQCPKCKKVKKHKSDIKIYMYNVILILCLKRLNEDNSKIKTLVSIPIQLNLGLKDKGVYELYAAIVHQGEFNGGHYVAYCYDYRNQFWAEYNDERVTIIELKQVQQKIKNAYLLFYQMKQSNV